MARLPAPPDLAWDEEGAPRALEFDDIYFSRAGGLEETRAVFHAGCGLPERWRGRRAFSILELGFGAGLNALATWAAWDGERVPGSVLHFTSIEASPMSAPDARRALAQFPELDPYTERLLAAWPPRARGAQRIWFDGFALTLICADVAEALAGLEGRFDAIFLDGFTPARNAAMWAPAVMARLAQVGAPDARAATYSVAGDVRRALEGAGFVCEKKPGFAGKRQRLEARLRSYAHAAPTLTPYAAAPGRRVAIIGGGIAGACAAAAFLRRGIAPTIYDAGEPKLPPAALVMPRLDRDELAPARLYRAAYLEALRLYEEIGMLETIGAEERPFDEADAALLADIAHDPPLDTHLLQAHGGGLFHPRAGLVSPARALTRLTRGAARRSIWIKSCVREGGGWRLEDENGFAGEADIVLLCGGRKLAVFDQTRWLPLEYSRGQLDWGAGPHLDHALVSSAYAAPHGDEIVFGATFDPLPADAPVSPDAESTARNLAALARLAPELAQSLNPRDAWAGVRASTNDRMPIAGLLPDARTWTERFASLKDGRAPTDMGEPPPAHDGLYVLGAFGARGFSLAPILGERIASEALGEPQALDRGLIEAIHPVRFLVRALKRGQALKF